MFKIFIQSSKTAFAIGADTVPPYCVTPFGLSIATYTTTSGSSAGVKPINESM